MPINAGCCGRTRFVAWFSPLFLLTALFLSGCAQQETATGPFPRYAEFQGEEVKEVSFAGDLEFPTDSLNAVVRTRASRCRFLFLPFCVPIVNLGRQESRLDLDELARDIVRLQLYHRDHGFYSAVVEPSINRVEEGVAVTFVIAPGRQVILRDLIIAGADTLLDTAALLDAIPLDEGAPFGRVDFLASADTIQQRLLQRGYAYADVLRNYAIDTIAGVAEAEYIALPGPLVTVDTVIVAGNQRLSSETIRRQLAFGQGDILRATALSDSQRNLYALDMINFATIRLAADTVQADQERHRATVLVDVVEAAQYAVQTSAGFGTVDCFRTSGTWLNRNFIGGGRSLEVTGSLSRLGVGDPVNLGLDRGGVCTAIGEAGFLDLPGFPVEDRVDYQLAANLQQPRLFGTQNQINFNVHSERISEVDAYIRESIGGSVTAVRELDFGPTILTTTLDIDRGRTVANPALLCVGFDTCTQSDLELLRQYRWSNSLSSSAVFDRSRVEGAVSSGYVLRGAVDWASEILLSDDNYLRVLAEGAYYHPLKPGWVLATNLRFGRFLQGVLNPRRGYIPPERRFYGGGPTSVRGYTRNALGPTTYIETPGDTIASATGGTELFVSSVELRMPSPILSDVARFAAFIDAGSVSAPGSETFNSRAIRFTPGVGLRFITPVGPFRLDVAYNPYAGEPGPLYIADPGTGLLLDDPDFRPDPPSSILGRFRIQFALGQAF